MIRAKLLARLSLDFECSKDLVLSLSAGACKTCPFSGALLDDCRRIICDVLDLSTHRVARLPRNEMLGKAEGQPFHLNLLAALALRAGDPDTRVLAQGRHSYATGVPIGVRRKMPRTPAVFPRKVKWRPLDITTEDYDMHNYSSAKEALPALEKQMKDEAEEGGRGQASLSGRLAARGGLGCFAEVRGQLPHPP